MPFAQGARDHRIHYRDVGERGPALVLVQGIGLDGRFWFDTPERLAADLDNPWRVLVPDNRGVGRSDLPSRPWSMADMADDVAAVLDHAGVRQAVIVGISMGGMIAQHVALRHPERVNGLVLMATTPGLPHGKLPELDTLGALLSAPLRKAGHLQTLAKLVLPEHAHDRASELLAGWIGLMREHQPRKPAFFGQLGAVLGHSTGRRLARIRVPTRVVTGDRDSLVPPANSKLLSERIPNATLEILTGVGHGIPLLDREVVLRNANLVRPAN
ncbi:alpha/beta fold hydrolase [Nannocystaceae bacterium ST9]